MSQFAGIPSGSPTAVGRRARQAGDRSAEARTLRVFPWLAGLLLVTLGVSFLKGQAIFVFAYILIVSYAIGRHTRRGQPWSEIGIKRGFLHDLGRVWPLSALDLVFQILPPMLGVAFLLGFGPELADHIVARLPVAVGAGSALPAVAMLLVVMAPLALVEEIVYRVTLQDELSRSIGTPAAIVAAALVFGLAHAVGGSGSPAVVLSDIAGVVLDGVIFGLIYARTHNLAVTWATHYAVDVVGLLALLVIL